MCCDTCLVDVGDAQCSLLFVHSMRINSNMPRGMMSTHGILASKSSLATLGALEYFARQQRDLQSRQGLIKRRGEGFKCGE